MILNYNFFSMVPPIKFIKLWEMSAPCTNFFSLLQWYYLFQWIERNKQRNNLNSIFSFFNENFFLYCMYTFLKLKEILIIIICSPFLIFDSKFFTKKNYFLLQGLYNYELRRIENDLTFKTGNPFSIEIPNVCNL